MPDLKPHASECRFYNCTHLHEPGCDVQAAVLREGETAQPGRIEPSRYRIYRTLFEELSQPKY
jgi:ribosome biogenesis GTPase